MPDEFTTDPTLNQSIGDLFEFLEKHIAELNQQKDRAYKERNLLLVLLAKVAIASGYDAGLGKCDPEDTSWEADWQNVVFIELPGKNGRMDMPVQCSWHVRDSELEDFSFLPPYKKPWDGHSTEEKYKRILETDFT